MATIHKRRLRGGEVVWELTHGTGRDRQRFVAGKTRAEAAAGLRGRALGRGGAMTPRSMSPSHDWPIAPLQDATVDDRLHWYPAVARLQAQPERTT